MQALFKSPGLEVWCSVFDGQDEVSTMLFTIRCMLCPKG
jgi:hypothetical protein